MRYFLIICANRLKVYSGDNFSDIQKVASDLNRDINTEICQATGKTPMELLEVEKPYLLKTDLNILTGYFDKL